MTGDHAGLRLRRSRTLVVAFSPSGPVVQNFMTRYATPLDAISFDLLCRASDWIYAEQLVAVHAQWNPWTASASLQHLAQNHLLVIEGSPAAQMDMQYEEYWKWDTTAGLYHFAMKDPPYMTPPQANQWMEYCGRVAPEVPLYTTNELHEEREQLEPAECNDGILSIMQRRRSIRSFAHQELNIAALRDCLFAGFGITGFLDAHVEGSRALPVKMAPSGGARNPYEGYVWVNRVERVRPGLYHYSGIENSLGLITATPAVSLTELLVGQYWAEDAGAVILLVANFDRTMWKYPNATAYRVVLIEAGHIAQNIALAASSHDLSTVPTAAISDTCAHRILNLNWIKQSLVYAVLLGSPAMNSYETRAFTPHR